MNLGKKIQKPGTELASFLEKNPTKIQKIGFWELSQRHFWKKNPDFFHEYIVMIFLEGKILGTEQASFLEKKSIGLKISVKLLNAVLIQH